MQLAEQRRLASLPGTVDDGHPEVPGTLLNDRCCLPPDQLSWVFSLRHVATLAPDLRLLRLSRASSSRFAEVGLAFRGASGGSQHLKVLDTCAYIDLDVIDPAALPAIPEITAMTLAELHQGAACSVTEQADGRARCCSVEPFVGGHEHGVEVSRQ